MAAAASEKLRSGYPTPGPQHPTPATVTDHVFFLNQAQWKNAREVQPYDHIIVGSGFCALGFANRVFENNPKAKILIVERGEYFLPEHFQNLPMPFTAALGGLSETFPWTLTKDTFERQGADRYIAWQHGMVPFFGGRSIMWSAWCPRPTPAEMDGWPQETQLAAQRYFGSAEKLLCVQKVDSLARQPRAPGQPRVYGKLQLKVQSLLESNHAKMRGVYRTEAAPIACAAERLAAIDFAKFSTPAPLLALRSRVQADGGTLDIATGCIVNRILQQDGTATALDTSRGILPVGRANVILAVGTLPAATLARNSFPTVAPLVGNRFTAHFITAVVARVPRSQLENPADPFESLEIAACYIAGVANKDFKQQFHVQLSVLSDKCPGKSQSLALRYMPDVVATATQQQLETSKDHVVFVCAVLGELDHRNPKNRFSLNPDDKDVTTNSLLHCTEDKSDLETWNAMDDATFDMLENVMGGGHANVVEYWQNATNSWAPSRPSVPARRVDALVHEGSTTHLGTEETAPVDVHYKLRSSNNVYVTGAGLWPQGGSWNPTMTMVALSEDLADKLSSVPQTKK